jgi:hypothetical protein
MIPDEELRKLGTLTKTAQTKYEKLYAHAHKLYELTDWNDHTGHVVYLASKVVRDKKAAAAARDIETLHEFFGHMPFELGQVREEIRQQLMVQLERKLGPKDYELFQGWS